MTSKLDAALDLAGKGFRVFPLDINSKTPICEWQEAATTDPEKIKSLWTCPVFDVAMDYNIGVALSDDTLVVDVDIRDGKRGDKSLEYIEAIHDELPATYTVVTPTGGEHRYFRTDRDSATFPAKLAEHIDLKGGNGYVVGPGSTIDGRAYAAQGEAGPRDVALAPGWLRDLPATRRKDDRGRVGATELAAAELDQPSALARAIDYLKSAPDHGTFQRAARVKDFGVSQDACLSLMLEHWPGADTRTEDHIAFRVENAFRYGQNAPGSASPEAEFEAVDIPADKPKRGKLWLEWWADAKPDLDQPYLIDDVYDLNTMVVTYGESNSGKTYVVLDQAFAIAAGREWNGHKVKKGLVVYVAAEGGRGFRKRIAAFRQHYRTDNLPFALVPCPIDLFASATDTRDLVALVREAEAAAGEKCAMVVVDTLARAMGGGDENSGADMGVLLKNCDRIRAALGATFHLIHHSGKDKAKGARGWSGLRGHIDTEIEVAPGSVTVTKQRDMEKIKELAFTLKGLEVGQRTDGRAVTACVVEWSSASEFEVRVSPQALQMLDLLEQKMAELRDLEPDNPDIEPKIPWSEWRIFSSVNMLGARGCKISEQQLYKLRKELSDSGLVERDAKNQWFTVNSPTLRKLSEIQPEKQVKLSSDSVSL